MATTSGTAIPVIAALGGTTITLGAQLLRERQQRLQERQRQLQKLLDAAATSLYGVQATLVSMRSSVASRSSKSGKREKLPRRSLRKRYEEDLREARSHVARLSVHLEIRPEELDAYRRAIEALTVEPLESPGELAPTTWRDAPAAELEQRLRQADLAIDEFHAAIRASRPTWPPLRGVGSRSSLAVSRIRRKRSPW